MMKHNERICLTSRNMEKPSSSFSSSFHLPSIVMTRDALMFPLGRRKSSWTWLSKNSTSIHFVNMMTLWDLRLKNSWTWLSQNSTSIDFVNMITLWHFHDFLYCHQRGWSGVNASTTCGLSIINHNFWASIFVHQWFIVGEHS